MTHLVRILAGGKMKHSPLIPMAEQYRKRMHLWSLELQEVETFEKREPAKKEAWIILDERGKPCSSPQFKELLESVIVCQKIPTFLIGTYQGFPPDLMAKAFKILSFGSPTWPHLLARLMLLEQIYRAQQAILGHPYSL
jgi:23S rRNA (pseudouridine1915-N3)-methyltransferase